MKPPGKAYLDAQDAPSPTFEAKNGAVHYNGVWLPECTAMGLLARFEAAAADRRDHFHTCAGELAAQLRGVLADVTGGCGLCGAALSPSEISPAVFDTSAMHICTQCLEDTLDASTFNPRSEMGLVGSCGGRS